MKVIRAISRFFVWLTMVFIAALMLMMVAEVVLRTFFNTSILGATEWAALLLLFDLTAMGAAVLSNRMIKVNMVTTRLPKKAQVILDIILLFLCFVAVGYTAWRQFAYSMTSMQNGVRYTTIGLPQWPFIALFALSYGVGAITALCVMIRKIANAAKGNWLREAELEDMDPVFVFGKNIPPRIKMLMEGKDPKDGENISQPQPAEEPEVTAENITETEDQADDGKGGTA